MNVYIGNLPLEITEEELRQEFVAFGPVTTVSIMNDKYIGSGQPKGYGFVEMESKSQGEAAIVGLQGKTLLGRIVNIVEALPLSDHKNGTAPVPSRRFSGKGRRRKY